MKISSDTATSLGDKLAGLDLTDEEGVLLTTLIGPGNDVEGFNMAKNGDRQGFYDEVEIHFRTNVLGPLPGAWKVEEGEKGYTEVEWTY